MFFENPSTWKWEVEIPDSYYNLWVFLQGEVEVALGNQTFSVTRPSYFLMRPEEQGRIVNTGNGPMQNFILHIDHRCFKTMISDALITSSWGTPVYQYDRFHDQAEEAARLWLRGDPVSRAVSIQLAQLIFYTFWRDITTPPHNEREEKMILLMDAIRFHPEKQWQIEVLAHEHHLSRSQFTRRFVSVADCSPRAFITRCRIDKAIRFLTDSSMNISEISEALNYSDVFYFSRQFKQETGRAPSAYRRGR